MALQSTVVRASNSASNYLAEFLRRLAGDLRAMAMEVDNSGFGRVATAVAVIVIATVIIGAGTAGIVATYTNGRLEERMGSMEQRMSSGFCHVNQRLDEIQKQQQSRQCE